MVSFRCRSQHSLNQQDLLLNIHSKVCPTVELLTYDLLSTLDIARLIIQKRLNLTMLTW